ncbi:MAG: 1-acyl-sn-glycerol-3-phosphate acyltransferase [Candidatus Shapirobacteria bacterium]
MIDGHEQTLPTQVNKDQPKKLEWGRSEWVSYSLRNWKSMIPFIPMVKDIASSAKNGEKRSLTNDLVRAGEIFKTNTIIEGEENIPETGGAIFAISHVAATNNFPGWGEGKDNIIWWAVGVANALKNRRGEKADFRPMTLAPGGLGGEQWRSVLDTYGGFPIDQNNPREAIRSIMEAKTAAENGDVVLISPEGETYTGLTEPKRGLIKIASSGIPIIPVGFLQEQQTDGSYVYHVLFGEQIVPDADKLKTKTDEIKLLDSVMEGMARLLPEEMRGVYSTKSKETDSI